MNGKIVFITGAAGGIGAEVARRLIGLGAKLVLTDADGPALMNTAAELGLPDRVLAAAVDVRDLDAMQAVADRAVAKFGGIDVVLANAGIIGMGSVLNIDPTIFKKVLEVDLLGVFHTVRCALPGIIERKGYVLIVSSAAAFSGAPGITPYSAAKAGIEQLANGLRIEMASYGVDVGVAHMSWVDTPMVREAIGDGAAQTSTFQKMFGNAPGPIGRTVSAGECAAAFIQGMQGRKKLVFCPPWVGILRWIRPLLSSSLFEAPLRKVARELLPQLDAEVAAQGGMSPRLQAIENADGKETR